MSQRVRALFIVPVLLTILAAHFFSQEDSSRPFAAFQATSPPDYGFIRQASHSMLGPRLAPTPLPTALPPVKQPAAYIPPPTSSRTPAAVVSKQTIIKQLTVLDLLWKTVNQEYLYTDFNGLNWDDVYTQYHELVEAGLSDEQFYQAMEEMVFKLGDEHSTYLTPEEVTAEDTRYAGGQNYVGVGFLLAPVPARHRATVLVTFPGGPAEKAGILAHDSILAVDGEPILDDDGRLKPIIRGPENTIVVLTLQSPGEEPRNLALVRRQISGPIPVPYTVLETYDGKRIGYILLVSLADSTVDERLGEAIAAMTASKPLDGLIIDNRQNEGGANTVLNGVLAYFIDGTAGYFVSRQEERPLEVSPVDVNGSQSVPLVVLVGENTYSYGEVMSGVLQDTGRAFVIGMPTGGNVETLRGYNLPDGSRAWIAHDSFRPYNHPEQDWEDSGIVPNLVVAGDWDEFTLTTDPAVQAAVEHFSSLWASE